MDGREDENEARVLKSGQPRLAEQIVGIVIVTFGRPAYYTTFWNG